MEHPENKPLVYDNINVKHRRVFILCHVLQFHQFCEDDGTMTERDFANQILLYAGFSDPKRLSICRRVRKEFKGESQKV